MNVSSDFKVCCCSDTDEAIDETTKSASKNCPVHKNEVNRGSPGPFKYELFSIMIHSGSASGGHYFAYIKDFDTNEWFCFNDDVVSPVSTLLFYFIFSNILICFLVYSFQGLFKITLPILNFVTDFA